MVIRSMNSLFIKHGRVFFGVITVVIIISFVGFFTPGFTSIFSGAVGGGSSAGRILGKKIKFDELNRQSRANMIILSLVRGVPFGNQSVRDDDMDMAFWQLGFLRAAQLRGLRASDLEVAEFLRSQPRFAQGGAFDKAKYEEYVKDQLVANGLNKKDLDEAVRDMLTMSALEREVMGSVIVTSGEARTFFNMNNEKFDVRVGRSSADAFKEQAKSKLSDDAVQSFFNANKTNYVIPKKYKVEFVRFNYNLFEKDAEKELTEAALKGYFESHKDEFKTPDNKPAEFDAVKTKVREALLRVIAKKMAMEKASSFVVDTVSKVFESGEGKVEAVRKIFAASGLTRGTTDWFDAKTDSIKAIGREPSFALAVASLYENEPLSNAIEGERAAFVVLVTEKQKSRPAEFAEVKDKALADCLQSHAADLARDRAREIFKKISDSQNPAQTIDSLKDQMSFVKVDSFIPMMPPTGADSSKIVRLARQTPQGRLAPMENTQDGALLVFVDKRELPSDADFEKQKAFVEMQCKIKKSQAAWADFETWLQSQAVSNLHAQREAAPAEKGNAQQPAGLQL